MSQGTGDVICSSFPLHYNVTIIFLQMTWCFLRIHEPVVLEQIKAST